MKNAMKRLLASFCMTGLVGSVGCLAPESEVDTTEAVDPVFTVTVIDLDQGGIVVAEYTETLTEQLAAAATNRQGLDDASLGQSRQALSQSMFACTLGSALRLYENTNYSGASLCFTGTGTADLATYGWASRVNSIKPGGYPVKFSAYADVRCCAPCTILPNNVDVPNSSCESSKRYFRRDAGPCSPC